MKQPSFLARRTLGPPNYFLIAMAAAFLLAFVPRGARKAIQSNTNKAEDWLPSSYDEAVDLRWFRNHFIGEQFALLSWEGCTLGNTEKLNFLARKLIPSRAALDLAAGESEGVAQAAGTPTIKDRATWYKRVITGPEVIQQLSTPPATLSEGEAIRRLEGALVGPPKRDAQGESLGRESRTTCLIVYLSQDATKNNVEMRAAVEGIVDIAVEECGIARESIHMGGPPVDNITIDVEGERTLIRLASLSGVVGLALSYWCFRSIKLTSIVFAVGVVSAGMSLAIVFYFGIFEVLVGNRGSPRLGTVDAILMSMPAVVYLLGFSGALHTLNNYSDARREQGLEGAAETAVRLGWGPCALAAFTTAVGLGSLYTSDILPIKKFGMFTAAAVLGTVGLLFTILPVFLHRFPISDELVKRQSGQHVSGHLPNWAMRIFSFVIARHAYVFCFWLCVMAVVGFGMTKIGTSVQLLKLLDEDADLIHDYAWLETNLGNLVPMEVILTIPPERLRLADELAEQDGRHYRLTMLERLELMREIQERVEQLPEISRAMSVATFTPEATNSGFSSTADRSVDYATNENLERNRELLLDGDYLRMERVAGESQQTGRELWRLSARVAALSEDEAGVDYGQFVSELQAAIEPVLLAHRQRDLVIQQLQEDGRQLRGSRLVLLYRSAESSLPSDSQEMLLGKLLVAGGAKGASVPTTFNLANFDDPPVDGEQAALQYREKAIEALKSFDAVVLSSTDDEVAEQLSADGLRVIDAHVEPTEGERLGDIASASSPLAVEGQPRPIRAVYTGMVPLVYKTQRQLLQSLRESIAWATVLIAVVMMAVLRSPTAGVISMIPNVFPIVMVFGSLGWLGVKVDIGIMMTASVALGVAVDDTVHFLTWFRRGVKTGLNRTEATMLAYDRCATAMMQTTLIGGLGLAVFATSTFTPTQQFGYLMITMLGAALIGDLLLLPAILAGPLGRFFGGGAEVVDPAFASAPAEA
ncbi:MAG: MMPL family transporter, partial [Planctomycetota bacterium]